MPLAIGGFFILAVVLVMAPPSASASATYSGQSFGGDEVVYGWGVTDVNQYGMMHTAQSKTTIRSPNGRTHTRTKNRRNYARADVQLLFLEESGEWKVETIHDAWCTYMGHFIRNKKTDKKRWYGYDVNWYKYDHHDPYFGTYIYNIIVPCDTDCNNAPSRAYYAPVGDEIYLKEHYRWVRFSSGGDKFCLIGVAQDMYESPGACVKHQ
jgi:hypothetical protein